MRSSDRRPSGRWLAFEPQKARSGLHGSQAGRGNREAASPMASTLEPLERRRPQGGAIFRRRWPRRFRAARLEPEAEPPSGTRNHSLPAFRSCIPEVRPKLAGTLPACPVPTGTPVADTGCGESECWRAAVPAAAPADPFPPPPAFPCPADVMRSVEPQG